MVIMFTKMLTKPTWTVDIIGGDDDQLIIVIMKYRQTWKYYTVSSKGQNVF